ncbi:chemotaxis protein CheW [Janthinobacterium fluminis]|uniref:Chemotaxis protein CheW n=1 Tax=Janthinobacterium fluminis TaxID=2987524 RepID=A0ABT5K669_9BURK|nr:chemotaxis protein CheW [Janthinobacterium fluminis]MDC8760501.1 chemotaxis protein CheW [Janthinobacterium fluminis]
MKALIFHLGADRYALPLGAVVRVLPLLQLKRLPQAPAAVAGLMDFHGTPVPVVELCVLAGLAPAPEQVDTRIVVVDYAAPDGGAHWLGLLAQQVRGVQEVAPAALRDSGVAAAPFLGQVASDAAGIVQLVELAQLLPQALRAALFPRPGGGA